MTKTINLNVPVTAAEREATSLQSDYMRKDYIKRMRTHVDEGAQLSHQNGVDLLAEVERLQALVPVYLGGTRT